MSGLGEYVYQISGLYHFSFGQEVWHKEINKQGIRGDMRKILVTWKFFEASRNQGNFFEKTKN